MEVLPGKEKGSPLNMSVMSSDPFSSPHDEQDGSILPVPRIPLSAEPDGVACDWMNGVDDGSMLLISVVGSPALSNLYLADGSGQTGIQFGEEGSPSPGTFQKISDTDGFTHLLGDGFVKEDTSTLMDLGVPMAGEQFTATGLTDMTVLSQCFYRPPDEFDLNNPTNPITYRSVPLAVEINIGDTVICEGAKQAGVILTRPPLVLVHGINSSPGVWFDKSGGTSFVDSVKDEYAGIYEVDHRGADPEYPLEGPTYGEGETTDMYTKVRDMIAEATSDYRTGRYLSPSPDETPDPDTNEWGGALIAVQKVDVVAHSYGGILTRWYVEQSPEYAQRRDVRKIIELSTPNLGSPLANMVDEVYRNPSIASAHAYGVGPFHPEMIQLLADLDKFGKEPPSAMGITVSGLANADSSGMKPMPFFEDDSVNSSVVMQLASHPFNDDIGYGAVVGTSRVVTLFKGKLEMDLYQSFQPMDGNSSVSYFPWLYQFDNAPGETDGVVPTWSSSLGVSAYNFPVDLNHVSLVQGAAVQQKVLAWLNDPNLPLGSQQRAGYNSHPPINDSNAYQGAMTRDSSNHLTGGGVNPDAIIGMSFPVTGMGPARWDTLWTNVGIKRPVLTGMIRYGDIGNTDFSICELGDGLDAPTILDDLGNLGLSALNVPPTAIHGNLDTWVPFRITIGRLGRMQDQRLTGPNDNSDIRSTQTIVYKMSDLPYGRSPKVVITLPKYGLPAPAPGAWAAVPNSGDPPEYQMNITLSGSVESNAIGGGDQVMEADLYLDGLFSALIDKGYVRISRPTDAWVGVLLPYTVVVPIYKLRDGRFGSMTWYSSNPSWPVNIYQYLRERSGVSNPSSGMTTISQ